MYNSERIVFYKTLFVLGLIGSIWAVASANPFLLIVGIVMIVIGLRNRKRLPVT